jgi:imidazole glycerol-phosphate synthase subunit HisF
MLKKRIIPKLLIRHRQMGHIVRPVLVTTRQYDETVDVGDAVSQAKIYEAQLADELIVLNIDNTAIGDDEVMLGLIERLASETFMPLAVGGGVRKLDDFGILLERGADKVSINSAAVESPELIDVAAARYGAQCVVVSIDYRIDPDIGTRVYKSGGRVKTDWNLLEWAHEAARRGAGELHLVNVERDGTGSGLDLQNAIDVIGAVNIPVILSGGCGLAAHFTDGFATAGAEGVAAGTFFALRDQNPIQTRAHIMNAGVPIRAGT